MRVELAGSVVAQRSVQVEVRPTLYANKCDGCGRVFSMTGFSGNEEGLAELCGTFEHALNGNIFVATVCSFKCAHEILVGGWMTMPEYKRFAEAGVRLVRARVQVTVYLKDEAEIRQEWEKVDQTPPPDTIVQRRCYTLGPAWSGQER